MEEVNYKEIVLNSKEDLNQLDTYIQKGNRKFGAMIKPGTYTNKKLIVLIPVNFK